jgi:hypothetical protein
MKTAGPQSNGLFANACFYFPNAVFFFMDALQTMNSSQKFRFEIFAKRKFMILNKDE